MHTTLIYSDEYLKSLIYTPTSAKSRQMPTQAAEQKPQTEAENQPEPQAEAPKVSTHPKEKPVQSTVQNSYSDNDLYWLSRIIEAEAKGESYEGKVEVGACIINRVRSAEFPNTIYGVIFDTKNGVQYQPIANGTIYNTPSSSSLQAAKQVLQGNFSNSGAMYFCSQRVVGTAWAAKNRRYCKTIGGHVFYY